MQRLRFRDLGDFVVRQFQPLAAEGKAQAVIPEIQAVILPEVLCLRAAFCLRKQHLRPEADEKVLKKRDQRPQEGQDPE